MSAHGIMPRPLKAVLLAVTAVAIVLAAAVYLITQTAPGHALLARFISSQLSTDDQTIIIGLLGGKLPSRIELSDLRLIDRQGEWLRLRTVRLDWNPSELLKGRVHVSRALVDGVHFARTPATKSRKERASMDVLPHIPDLPVAVTIERVSIENLELAEPVLGRALTVRGRGSAEAARDSALRADLIVETTAGSTARADMSLDLNVAHGALSADISMHDSEGGVLASALGLPRLAGNLRVRGAFDDWRASVEAVGGDSASLIADIDMTVESGRRRLIGEGHANFSHFLAPPVSRLFSEGLSFVAAADVTDAGSIVLESGRLFNDALTLELGGTLSAAETGLEATMTAEAAGLRWLVDLVPGASMSDLTINTQVSGPLLQPHITLDLRAFGATDLESFADEVRGRLEVNFDHPIDKQVLPVELTGEGRVAGLAAAALTGLRDANWTLDSRIGKNSIGISSARAFNELIDISASGNIGLDTRSIDLDLNAEVPDITRFEAVPDTLQEGAAALSARIVTTDLERGISAELTGKISRLLLDDPTAQMLTGPELSVAALLVRDPAETLTVDGISLRGNAIELSGEAEFSSDMRTVAARYRADMGNPAGDPFLPERLTLQGSAEGLLFDPHVSGTITLDGLQYRHMSFGSPQIRYEASRIGTSPQGRISLRAPQTALGTFDASTRFEVQDFDSVWLTDLRLAAGETSAEGELLIAFESGTLAGSIDGRISDLGQWTEIAGRRLAGELSFAVALADDGDAQRADFALTGRQFSMSFDSLVASEHVEVKATLEDVFDAPRGDLRFTARDASYGDVTLKTLDLDATSIDPHSARLALELSGNSDTRLSSGGTLGWDDQSIALDLQRFEGRLFGRPVAMEPTRLSYAPGRLDLDEMALDLAGGEIRADASLSRDGLDIRAEVTRLPLDWLDRIYATGLKGSLSAVAVVRGPQSDPVGEATLRLEGLRLALPASGRIPEIDGTLKSSWKSNRLAITGQLTGLSDHALNLTASVPLELMQDSGGLRVSQLDPVSGRLQWQGDVEPLFELLGLHDHYISGSMNLDAELGGALDAPQFRGVLELREGEYENRISGTYLHDVAMRLHVDGQRVAVEGNGSDGGTGRVDARGSIDLGDPLVLDLVIDLDKSVLVRLDEFTATASGSAALRGPVAGLRLAGELTVDKVEARLVEKAAATIPSLDVLEINHPADSPNRASTGGERERQDPAVIYLDLGLVMPAKIFLRGRGLESEWAGRLQVSGTDDRPVISGQLTPVRGGFTFAGKEFKLGTGSVRFDGTDDIDPILNLPGEYKGRNMTAIISIVGRASNSKIRISSRPPMPESQVLSQVLFDKDAGELTAGQKIELAAAAATLTGNGGGGIMEFARRSLGVDTLTLRETQEGNKARVSAGKYLTDKVYVEVEQGADTEPGTARIELEVAPKIKVETGANATGDGRVGFKWRWDY